MISRLDYDLNNFIATYLTSLTSWDLLNYFHKNPKSDHTPEFFARSINHDVDETKEILETLAETGQIRLFKGKYYYQPTAKFEKDMAALVKMMENSETRRVILVNILKCSSNQRII